MKKILFITFSFLLILAIVILLRTLFYPFPETSSQSSQQKSIPEFPPEALKRFQKVLQIATVSNSGYALTNFKPFEELRNYLFTNYSLFHKITERDIVNSYGLVYRWKGRDSSLKPILFLAHMDVVPGGDLDGWDHPPFSGKIAEGRIYGRGTLDMKNVLFGLLESSELLMKENYQPKRDIYFAFGHDEEVGGREGALKIAEYFKEKGLEKDTIPIKKSPGFHLPLQGIV